jgi:hypothetical protein
MVKDFVKDDLCDALQRQAEFETEQHSTEISGKDNADPSINASKLQSAKAESSIPVRVPRSH